MRCLYIVIALFFSRVVSAQHKIDTIKQLLIGINSIDQAKRFLKESEMDGDILTIGPKIDSSAFAKLLISKETGEVLTSESNEKDITYLFKILKIDNIKSFRVQYIFLDNTKLNLKQIDSLRSLIFKRIGKGDKFESLAKEYSMDGNSKKEGDLGWFEEGQMMKEFEDSILKHRFEEVFKVDIAEKKWYYIVKNSHIPRYGKKATVLYLEIKNSN
jgi:PPIC-type PPIASE domain